MEEERRSRLSAQELIDRGYYQVSRKYRMVARLGTDGLPDDRLALELDFATFDEFRSLGGVTWSEGVHRDRLRKDQARLLELLTSVGLTPSDAISERVTVRDLYVRLGVLPLSDDRQLNLRW